MIKKALEGGDRDLFHGSSPTFAWRDWGKLL